MIHGSVARLLCDRRLLIDHIEKVTVTQAISPNRIRDEKRTAFKSSAVLFPLCVCPAARRGGAQICLMLTKRSHYVRQPGDLCCPGGGYSLPLDRLLGALLDLPGSPLRRWAGRQRWKKIHGRQMPKLKLLLAAGLREAWEEIRLNPLKTRFLGPLPEQRLVLFNRVIYPLAVWVDACRSIQPNSEVERVVCIPLRGLLDPQRYGRFRPWQQAIPADAGRALYNGFFPCYVHQDAFGQELVWGATLRVVQDFLAMVFGFHPPTGNSLPIVRGLLDVSYPHGVARNNRSLLVRND